MEEWQNGHDQPGYHYHQEQDKKRKPIETPGKRFWKMWGPLLIKWGIGTPCQNDTRKEDSCDEEVFVSASGGHDGGIYEDALSDAGGIRSIDV